MSEPLWQQDATALIDGMDADRFDPVDVLEAFTARIDSVNALLNAVVCPNPTARLEAEKSARRRATGGALSRIDGLPILIKDNLVASGMPATWGCPLYRDRVATHDEIPVERLRRAGAVILGKTNVPEFTIEGFTDNTLFGPTRNPWDRRLTPGGSSGGSVAAVAAGLAPWSVGTDGGGSIRRPAAYTNLVGLKPSIGRVARGGGLPQLLLDMEVVGLMTRTLRDQVLLMSVLGGADHRDHRSVHLPEFDRRSAESIPIRPLRILAVQRFDDAPLDPAIARSFDRVLGILQDLGHRIDPGEMPLRIDELNRHWASIAHIGLARLLEIEPHMAELASTKYVEWARTTYPATHLLALVETIRELRDAATVFFQNVDLVMTPSCAAMPWAIGTDFPPEIDGRPVGPRGSAVYTGWVNACGLPAISLPAPPSDDGLPIGVQFVAGFAQEELLLQLGRQLEPLIDWPARRPELPD